MTRQPVRKTILVLFGCAALVAACNNSSVPPRPQTAETSRESFEKFGNYELHFNGVRTDQLTPDIASRYGIERSTKRVLLNVALLHRDGEGALPLPIDAAVIVNARTLNGQLKDIAIRRVTEGSTVSYIGEVSLSGSEILIFDIKATPAGESQPFAVTFQREFFAE
ncbi:MAG: DUF4426 domain-containing protein [Steroidobacteraceae bacterium]